MSFSTMSAAEFKRRMARPERGKRHQKYNNQRTTSADGEVFDSLAEHRHWLHLCMLQKAGKVRELRRQVAFELAPAVVIKGRKRPPLRYVADFVYVDERGQTVVADVKGAVTDVFRIKRHLMAVVHGIEIQEVRA